MPEEDYSRLLPEVRVLQGKKANLLLGTDRHIGEETPGAEETRVGIIPAQVTALKSWLQRVGVYLDFYFVQGAGARAGYSDGDYLSVGGQLVFEHELSTLPPPQVFHALKEPSPYESFVPGPFIRIGALHTGAFDPTSGLASLFRKKNFCAIFDGSNVGGFSHKISGGHAVPIRSSMSIPAGWIAADYVGQSVNSSPSKVIISGGGVVGTAAVERLLSRYKETVSQVIVIETNPKQCETLRSRFGEGGKISIVERGSITAEDVAGAAGLILTAFRPGHQAPKVVNVGDLGALAEGSNIVDVSIDEKGGILVPGLDYEQTPLLQVIERVREAINSLGRNIRYIGDSHLPRYNATSASEAHGRAVLPYLAALLYLSAREGGAPRAIEFILRQDSLKEPHEYFELLLLDLKQGLAFWRPDPIHAQENITTGIMSSMGHFVEREGIQMKVE